MHHAIYYHGYVFIYPRGHVPSFQEYFRAQTRAGWHWKLWNTLVRSISSPQSQKSDNHIIVRSKEFEPVIHVTII
jgi:hypothetical protein